ncbi:LPXTG cell wall anchor domain-containing protein [Terribacillus sp. DMT04]|uniref:LPXTG cell wall anchor domain-containing protein n=1 Tax=Terribacillus sp. DMT04 TaxID=2850441 RepID=UPI001C2BFF80|nr:LPXTG cell wall anchor domain-containing protein [Terribacillus sp. DMT04]QXE01285.1 LPXTG cell wall anchor domain-containing protein [Terribacillus sp. DMT04]
MSKFITSLFIFALLVVGFASGASAADNDKDCKDFEGKPNELVQFWNDNGYSESNDPHDLDRDNDNLPCETTKADFDNYAADSTNKETENDEAVVVEEEDNDSNTSTQSEVNTNTSAEKEDSAETAAVQQGEELPKTATNNGVLMLISGGLVAAGLITFALKKTQKA